MEDQRSTMYFENLDGLRFICFLSVFLFHSFHTNYDFIKNEPIYSFIKFGIFGNGNLGVNFFFVLSGFLITYLLFKEKEEFGKIDIIKFWVRRILRIWPLFFFCVFFGFIIFPLFKILFGQQPLETADPLYYLFFINNFDIIQKGLPDASVLGALWSIAVEEQFYFFWPLFLAIFGFRYYPFVFAFIIIVSLFFRIVFRDPILYEYHTLSCMGDMAVGAFGAYMIRNSSLRILIFNLRRELIITLYLMVLSFFFLRSELNELGIIFQIVERIAIAIIFLFVILEQNYSKNSFFKIGNFKFIRRLGIMAYGLYCFHFIGILITTNTTRILHINDSLWVVLIGETVVALLVTIVLAYFSYTYFEKPFLKLKQKFSVI